MLDGDARGLEAVGGERSELVFGGWSPAQLHEQREISFGRGYRRQKAARLSSARACRVAS
jgi:hypothetical protein